MFSKAKHQLARMILVPEGAEDAVEAWLETMGLKARIESVETNESKIVGELLRWVKTEPICFVGHLEPGQAARLSAHDIVLCEFEDSRMNRYWVGYGLEGKFVRVSLGEWDPLLEVGGAAPVTSPEALLHRWTRKAQRWARVTFRRLFNSVTDWRVLTGLLLLTLAVVAQSLIADRVSEAVKEQALPVSAPLSSASNTVVEKQALPAVPTRLPEVKAQ